MARTRMPEGLWSRVLAALPAALVPPGLFAALLWTGWGGQLGLTLRSGLSFSHLILWFLLFAALSRREALARPAALALTLSACALVLAGVWHSGLCDGSIIGGLLPFSDAAHYDHCARLLVEFGSFADTDHATFCSRRPLFSAALAGLLALTGQDLRATLALLALAGALGCVLAAHEIRATHGPAAASVFLLVLFLFYRRFVGTTLTEHLGLALGAAAFGILWRATARGQTRLWLLGLVFLTLALCARAGAFFVLPAAVLWLALRIDGATEARWRRLALATGAVAVGFFLNAALAQAVGRGEAGFSNFSYTFYGLVSEGDWTKVLQDHPDLASLGEAERSRRSLDLALTAVREEPTRLVWGCLRAWRRFLGGYAFVFVHSKLAIPVLLVASVLGIAACGRQRRAAWASFTLALSAGLVLSVPFAPPWDSDEMRVYAATLPLLAVLPALGAAFATSLVRRAAASTATASPEGFRTAPSAALPVFGSVVAGFALLAPGATALLARPPSFGVGGPACGDVAYLRAPAPGSWLRVVPNDAPSARYPFELRVGAFRRELTQLRAQYPALADELARARAPFALLSAPDLRSRRHVWVIADAPRRLPQRGDGQFWRVCSRLADEPFAASRGFGYAIDVTGVASREP